LKALTKVWSGTRVNKKARMARDTSQGHILLQPPRCGAGAEGSSPTEADLLALRGVMASLDEVKAEVGQFFRLDGMDCSQCF
jgi:hypothetical protein